MPDIVANNHLFEVIIEGPEDGQAVLLLHGFPETNYQWRRQIPVLSAAGYRVIAPNQRGISPAARPVDVAAAEDDALTVARSEHPVVEKGSDVAAGRSDVDRVGPVVRVRREAVVAARRADAEDGGDLARPQGHGVDQLEIGTGVARGGHHQHPDS